MICRFICASPHSIPKIEVHYIELHPQRRWSDLGHECSVYGALAAGEVKTRGIIVRKKTGRSVQVEITGHTRTAIAGLVSRYHLRARSLRGTKAALIHRKTGNLRAVQLLLGHTKLESTVRCLGVEVDDAIAISEGVDLQDYEMAGLNGAGHSQHAARPADCRRGC